MDEPMTAHHLLDLAPLDRPVWNSLTSHWAPLAEGGPSALRLAAPYGLFAAVADGSAESLAELAGLVPAGGAIALIEAEPPPMVPGMAEEDLMIWQMVAQALTEAPEPAFAWAPLTDADGPEMLALATLTRPGPYFERTHQLGEFIGVKTGQNGDGRLVAMAGERMRMPGFTEVSGVCTHPDHRGHGYAGGLSRIVAGRIFARGETPFLHAYAHNTAAIGLYETLGFYRRRQMHRLMLTRV
jgi:predicted GNAT family acetyltransferase